jgi:putative ABC transport system permease protein
LEIKFLFSLFATIGIIIACLGLFGLSSYITAQRTKEIGIRKVLGASLPAIIFMLSKDVLKLIIIALIVSIPFAWYLMSHWLENFSYQIAIGFEIFLLAAAMAIAISYFTVVIQSWKTAISNPMRALQEE